MRDAFLPIFHAPALFPDPVADYADVSLNTGSLLDDMIRSCVVTDLGIEALRIDR